MELSKYDYNAEQFKKSKCFMCKFFGSFALISSFLCIISLYFFSIIDFYFYFGIFLVVIGNYFIAFGTQYAHYYSSIDSKENVYPSLLRCSAGLSESFFYTFFFVFNQPLIIGGYLVIKGIGHRVYKNSPPKDSEKYLDSPRNNSSAREGQSVAILRIALIISLFISLTASCFIRNSSFYHSFVYDQVLEILSPLPQK